LVAIRANNLAFLLQVHKRAEYLPEIFAQMKFLSRGLHGHVFVRFDRPSQEVIRIIDRLAAKLPKRLEFTPFEGKARAKAAQCNPNMLGGLARRELHDFAMATDDFDAGMLWDDDVLFTWRALQDLRAFLRFLEHDRYDIRWAMCHGNRATENITFPDHFATALFKVYPNDRWNIDYVQHSPHYTAFSDDAKIMETLALHLGYMTDEDRQIAWLNAKASGKIDAHTLALVREPSLKRIQHPETEKPNVR